ncbi:Glyoxalase domain-containing protein 4 [Frankliniella fusca]|uniref:Glyoxalase domain-containing protein 4 n=1 Tax=Frankliniella fusca TaxID=407009 RepID=A0AAE1LTA3_9NEOP|nr:Glyoxalase domain-containing protein 4 [Frankliniella fusca]
MISGRALHYVVRVPDRKKTIQFYRDILGMKVLRHEEFREGCAAACNGGYDNRWSKTMVGYGPEDTHFVVELTYNYMVRDYKIGNDLVGITIRSSEALKRAKEASWPVVEENGKYTLQAPVGYKIVIVDEPQPTDKDPVEKISLAVSNLEKSINYWHSLLKMKVLKKSDKTVELSYGEGQTVLELCDIGAPIVRETAGGRIAFAVPYEQQPEIDTIIKKANQKILTPLISLDTPGKATVRVIILADPDGHEICFVDEEGFRPLSAVDPEGNALIEKYIRLDKSDQFVGAK